MVAVCLLQLLLLSLPSPVKPFSLTRIAANVFLKEESSATKFFLHRHDDVSDTSSRALQFNMTNLIRPDKDARRQNEKLIHLSSIIESCCSRLDDKESSSVVGDQEYQVKLADHHLTHIRCFINTSSHARDHRGCFRIFDCKDNEDEQVQLSLSSNVLLSMDRPIAFLRDSLSYQSDASKRKRGGMMYDGSEAVVWCSIEGDQDLKFSSRVMDDMPYAQLNLALSHDVDYNYMDDVEIDEETIHSLELLGVLIPDREDMTTCESNNRDSGTRHRCKIKIDDFNVIEAILPPDDTQVEQQTLIKLIDAAVESVRRDPLNEDNEPHLVLLAHSISSSVVASAISLWKDQQITEHQQSVQRVEDLLNQALTVVTFGNICRSFCDGPAYIHVSMYDDPWSTCLGAQNCGSGGQNAVYFQAWSPYEDVSNICSLKSHNAHNLNACMIQYLCLIMRINGIRSFRALYDAARFVDPTAILDINPKHFAVSPCNHGELVIPSRIDDELLPSMIVATGGYEWLWCDDGDESKTDLEEVLPDEIEAISHLEESFGYSVFEEIQDTCCKR